MKKLFLIFTLVAAIMLSVATPLAAAYRVMDQAQLLSPEQIEKLNDTLEDYENEYDVRLGVVTMPSIGDQKPGDFANKLIDDMYNDGENGGMVLLQVVDQRKWYISTDKKMKEIVVGNEGVEYMSKAFVPYLKKNDYAGAYQTYANNAGELLAYYAENGKGWAPEQEFPWLLLIGAVIIGAAGSYFYRARLVASMSNVRTRVEANAYLNKESFELMVTKDTYMYSNVSAVPRSKGGSNDNDGSVTDSSADSDHGGGGGGY